MRWFLIVSLGVAVVVVTVEVGPGPLCGEWPGVDEAVVKRFAEQAGRPPGEPYIPAPSGDMLLFFFLLAGAGGGFVAGYHFRGLFPPGARSTRDSSDV